MKLEMRKDAGIAIAYDLYCDDKRVKRWWIIGPTNEGDCIVRCDGDESFRMAGTHEEVCAWVCSQYAMREGQQ